MEYIESSIQNTHMLRIDDPNLVLIIIHTRFIEAIHVSNLYRYLHNCWTIDLLLNALHQEKKGENFYKACIGTLSYSYSSLIYRHLVCEIFTKTIIITSLSSNIHRLYVCDPLGPYILLVNNSIETLILNW